SEAAESARLSAAQL
ncbi:hypothetical protein Tco_0264176, partial [Tanacetum coccineum]